MGSRTRHSHDTTPLLPEHGVDSFQLTRAELSLYGARIYLHPSGYIAVDYPRQHESIVMEIVERYEKGKR